MEGTGNHEIFPNTRNSDKCWTNCNHTNIFWSRSKLEIFWKEVFKAFKSATKNETCVVF